MLRPFSSFWIGLLIALPLAGCASPPAISTQAASPPERIPVRPAAPLSQPPAVAGKSAIVIDAITGRILSAKNPDERRAVASTQKLLTALLTVETQYLDKTVTIDASDTRVEPTKLYLRTGETYTRRDLLKAIVVKSANDAALSLARDVGGSKENFARMMNQRAASLGMRSSYFLNPHGLTETGQHSTARDVAILARAAYQQPEIRRYMRTQQYVFVHSDGRRKTLTNTNKLLKRLPYATGMKTGTTNASGKCLVSSAEYNGRVAIAVILGSSNSAIWNDSEKLLRWALQVPSSAAP
jgi:D-alanyl-D-alanine carboxypeptidase (penicillin-binding protein 5/6)